MKNLERWVFITAGFLIFLTVFLVLVTVDVKGQEASKTTSTTTEDGTEDSVNSSQKQLESTPKLTGIPQIDYIWDPDLPSELKGYDFSTYPFLSEVPPKNEISFRCESAGFYASIQYKCQVYHHCVYGRYSQNHLCDNYTAFDQRTLTCEYANQVDCEGSEKYFISSNSPTTSSTTSSTTPEPPRKNTTNRTLTPMSPTSNRRPIEDEEVDDYEDDYEDFYKVSANKRSKHRPRKPIVDHDDDDDSENDADFGDENPRGFNSRDSFSNDEEPDDYKPGSIGFADTKNSHTTKPKVINLIVVTNYSVFNFN